MSTTSLPGLPEQVPPMPPQPPYVDRSTGLVLFGIVQILFGAFALLMIPLTLLGFAMSRRTTGVTVPPGSFFLGALNYAAVAAVLIAFGIGSITVRRWARALTLAGSWIWLIAGFLITILVTALMPAGFSQGLRKAMERNPNAASLPAGAIAVILTVMIVVMAVFLVGVPLAFVLFYRSKGVAETVRHKDPVERWTERIPIPVLAASMIFAGAGAYYLGMSFTTPLVPFFGRYLTGIIGAAACLVFAGIDGFIAVALARLHIAGWWVAVLVEVTKIVSAAITFGRGNLLQAYSRMGLRYSQLQMVGNSPFYRVGLYVSLFVMLIFLGFLLWIRRYFGRKTPAAPEYATPQV